MQALIEKAADDHPGQDIAGLLHLGGASIPIGSMTFLEGDLSGGFSKSWLSKTSFRFGVEVGLAICSLETGKFQQVHLCVCHLCCSNSRCSSPK